MDLKNVGEVIGAIVIICEAVKRLGVNSKYIPVLALLLGVGGALLFGGVDWANALVGITLGLGTTLGYREVKNTLTY